MKLKRWITIAAVVLLGACAEKPYEPTPTIYNKNFTVQSKDSTQIRVHRVQQLTGSGLGNDCPLVLKVDGYEVAGLQQNQYVDLYVAHGTHDLSIRFACAMTPWKKSLSLIADRQYQEYQTELGAAGQYRMWRIK